MESFLAWMEGQHDESLFTASLTVAEIVRGRLKRARPQA